MKKLLGIIPILIFAITAFAQFEHPDFKSGKKHINSVVLMPVQAEVSRLSMKGPEPMVEESRRVEKDLTPVIVEVLTNLGCKVNDTAVTPAALQEDPELKYVIDDLQKKFDSEMQMMVRKSKDVRKGRFTLGDSVTKLPAGENADAIVFVRAAGQVLTGGKKAFGLLIGGPAFDMVGINIGVVDAKTGEVLYFAKPFMLKNLAKDPADTRSGITKSFKNFSKANQVVASTASPMAPASNAVAPAGIPQSKPEPGPVSTPKVEEAAVANQAPPALETESTAANPASVNEVSPVSMPSSGSKVYVFVLRTENHVKRSDEDVFEQAMKGIADYLSSKNVVFVSEVPGKLSHADFTMSPDRVLEAARSAKADSVLYISVDRPVTKWIEFKAQCLDLSGKELWSVNGGSAGGFSGGHGLRVGLEHLQAELDKHLGQVGLPVLQPSQDAQGK